MVINMDNMHFERPKKKNFWEKQGFYVAIAVCLLAVGASSWIAVQRIGGNELLGESSSLSLSTPTAVDHMVSDVPYSEPEEPEASTAESSTPASSEPAPSEPASSQAVSEETEASPFFVLPVGGSILKNFDSDNLQYSETYKDWRLHLGIDIAADQGTPVLAAADGTVTEVREDALLGTVAVIDHGDGIIASYCGLNKSPSVKQGDKVEAGKQIGVIDTIPCESVEASHLHFSIEQNGVPISPLELTGDLG